MKQTDNGRVGRKAIQRAGEVDRMEKQQSKRSSSSKSPKPSSLRSQLSSRLGFRRLSASDGYRIPSSCNVTMSDWRYEYMIDNNGARKCVLCEEPAWHHNSGYCNLHRYVATKLTKVASKKKKHAQLTQILANKTLAWSLYAQLLQKLQEKNGNDGHMFAAVDFDAWAACVRTRRVP